MSLEGYVPETVTIPFKPKGEDRSFTVRGINLDDMSSLVADHLADIEAATNLFLETKRQILTPQGIDGLIMYLVREVPGLVAEVISTTAGERHLAETYKTLPFSVSALALTHIMRLSMEENGGLKNFFATLGMIAQDLLPENVKGDLVSLLKSRSSNGSTGSIESE